MAKGASTPGAGTGPFPSSLNLSGPFLIPAVVPFGPYGELSGATDSTAKALVCSTLGDLI